jgi:hypothetical protein
VPHPESDQPDGRPSEADRVTFTRSDFRTMGRAAREGWPLNSRLQAEAIFQAALILSDPKGRPTLKLRAAEYLVKVDKANLAADLGNARLELARQKLASTIPVLTGDEASGVDPAAAARALDAFCRTPEPEPLPESELEHESTHDA